MNTVLIALFVTMLILLIVLLGILVCVHFSFRIKNLKDFRFKVNKQALDVLKELVKNKQTANKEDPDSLSMVSSFFPFAVTAMLRDKNVFSIGESKDEKVYFFHIVYNFICVVPTGNANAALSKDRYKVFLMPTFTGFWLFMKAKRKYKHRDKLNHSNLQKKAKKECEEAIVELYTRDLS